MQYRTDGAVRRVAIQAVGLGLPAESHSAKAQVPLVAYGGFRSLPEE